MSRRVLDHTVVVPEEQEKSADYQDQGQNVLEIVSENVPKRALARHLLSLIKENPRTTYNELARATGLNRKTIQRYIRSLKDKGLLRRTGGARGGYWEVDAS